MAVSDRATLRKIAMAGENDVGAVGESWMPFVHLDDKNALYRLEDVFDPAGGQRPFAFEQEARDIVERRTSRS